MLTFQMPDVLTHTYHPTRGAFRNVCHLPPAEAETVIGAIRAEGWSCRKPDYLSRRWRTEDWLIAERARKLGTTSLSRPLYFFLGDMADGGDRSRPASVRMPLAAFDPGVLTFTCPDSMTSCPQLRRPDEEASGLCGQVYTLPEIEKIVRRWGFPDPTLPRSVRGADAFIEVQVWDDRPLAALAVLFDRGRHGGRER